MISANNITLRVGKKALFEDVNIKFTEGNCYGLIGANGAGKSTFLKILSGQLEPTNGDIVITPGQRLSFLQQDHFKYDSYPVLDTVIMGNSRLYEIMKEKEAIYAKEDFTDEDGIRASELEGEFAEMNGWEAESDAATLLNGLGIETEFHYSQMSDLTGSQKVKVLLAQALFGNPDILLLDEPTNHLDLPAIEWLEEFLINFDNTIIVVSHDRYFLNKVCTHTADIDYGKIQLYAGNYDFWFESSQLLIKQMKEANKKKEEKIKELQEFISRFSANASKSKQATSRKRALEKIQLDDMRPSSRKYPYIDFRPNREIGNEVLMVENLSKTIDGVKVLDNISFTLGHDDKVAFVGANEQAITTFFRILMGELEPDEGNYKWGVTTSQAYFPKDSTQEFDNDLTITDWLTQYSEIKDATYVRGFLGRMLFPGEDGVKRVKVLSGGEKVRCLLSKMMISGANILVLDEPTNHLDMESIAWLETYLKGYSGSVIIVAHDRYFLDRVVTKVIELDNGTATVFSGNYSAYSDKKAMLRDAQIRAYLNQQQEIRHQEAVIAKLKSFNREKSIRRAESREKMLDKIERLEKPVEINDSMDIRLEPDVVSGNDVLTVTDLSKSFDTQTLFTHGSFEIKRGERIAVIGNNGTGKTTLLKIINGLIPADAGEIRLGAKVHIGYYDQEHQVLHMDKTLFQEIQDTYPNMNNTQIRNTLASFLFTGDDVFKLIRDLSGGERGRVSLAKLMLSDANFLLLDEPTNHLDITSKEILESALNRYTGTVLYVSHDRYFINRTATRILDLTGQSFVNYIGNYDYYLEKKEAVEGAFFAGRGSEAPKSALGRPADAGTGASSGTAASSSASDTGAKLDWKAQKEEQARIRKRQNELKKTEDAIHQLETRDSEINELLALEEVYTDVSRLMELNKEKDSISEKLEKLYELWEALAEE